jgi:hypothetical protein
VGRKWFAVFFPPPGKMAMHFTPLGLMTNAYHDRARYFIQSWVEKLNSAQYGRHASAFLDTREPATRDAHARFWGAAIDVRLICETFIQLGLAPGACLPLGGVGPLMSPEDYDSWLYLKGFADFAAGKGVDQTDWEKLTRDEALRRRVRTQVLDSFFGRVHPGRFNIQFKAPEESFAPFRKADGKIRFMCDYDMVVGMTPQEPFPKYAAECTVVAEAPAVASADEVNSVTLNDWRIVSIQVTRLFELPQQGPMKLDPNQPGMPKRGGGPVR